MIAEVATTAEDIDSACDQLVDLANERGGEDNITVLLVSCWD